MSKKSDRLELDITNVVKKNIGKKIPNKLPEWMINEGIIPNSEIVNVEGIGSKDHNNKTDVIIYLKCSNPIKISAKLTNADYFGNWYGHKRFIDEFGLSAFNRATKVTTKWANKEIKDPVWEKKPFVGVSLNFGKRSGRTAVNFNDVFLNDSDLIKIAKGYGVGDSVANCLFISDKKPDNINDLISNLEEISIKNIKNLTGNFKLVMRPVNPQTENSNRGKNVYTQFKPFSNIKLTNTTIIRKSSDLIKLGEFVTVKPNKLNHNHILKDLKENYNIIIPVKKK